MPKRAQQSPAVYKTVTFRLSFPINRDGVRKAVGAFLAYAPVVGTRHSNLFEYWHASFHHDLNAGTHNELWFQFRAAEGNSEDLAASVGSDLKASATSLEFVSACHVVQDEETAFAQVISEIGGPGNMDALWRQVQTATEWAVCDRPRSVERAAPPEWYCWARHIYRNLLGLE